MEANPDNFQVIVMGLEKGKKLSLEINGISIRTTEEIKLHGIASDSKLQFQNRDLYRKIRLFPLQLLGLADYPPPARACHPVLCFQ